MTHIELPTITCSHCGHTWVPRTSDPKHCSKCNNNPFNKPIGKGWRKNKPGAWTK